MIAIISSKPNVGIVQDDLCLLEMLQSKGYTAEIVAWEDTAVDWGTIETAVIRSAWGYQHNMEAFLAWLSMTEEKGICLLNDANTVRRNIYKNKQFAALEALRLPLLETVFLSHDKNENTMLPAASLQETTEKYFDTAKKQHFVLKPIVSASGHDTMLFDLANPVSYKKAEASFQTLLAKKEKIGVMLQPFYEEVVAGEYSVIYLSGEYSHAVRRFPGVLAEKKTAQAIAQLPPQVAGLAEEVAEKTNVHALAYARIDILETKDAVHLMELELTEPALFFCGTEGKEVGEVTLGKFADIIINAKKGI